MVTAAQAAVEGHNNGNRYYTYLEATQDNKRIQAYKIITPIYRP